MKKTEKEQLVELCSYLEKYGYKSISIFCNN